MRKHKVLAVILAAVMLLGTIPAALAASVTTSDGLVLDKTASTLNSQWETKINLSVSPPAATDDAVAVEFVLDGTYSLFKNTIADVNNHDKLMIQAWAEAIQKLFVGKNVYVGVTVFGSDAYEDEDGNTLYPISKLNSASDFDPNGAAPLKAIKWLVEHEGTNVQAGIQSGMAELNSLDDETVDPANRYLVLLTDGGTYWRMDGNTAINDTLSDGTRLQNNDAAELDISGKSLQSKGSFSALMAASVDTKLHAYSASTLSDALSEIQTTKAYTNFEKGVYAAAQELDNIQGQAKLITVGYPYYGNLDGEAFNGLEQLNSLAMGLIDKAVGLSVCSWKLSNVSQTTEDINEIAQGIASQVGVIASSATLAAGSTITDVIGSGTDNLGVAYNFDLVTDKDITLTVNGTTYTGSRSGNTWTFGKVAKLEYTSGTNEKFVLTLLKDVTIQPGEKLVLSYTAKLTNPSTKDGTHTVYPNVAAYLTPDGGSRVDFPRPTLKYSYGSNDASSILNTEDHYSYIIGFSDGTVRPYGYITRGQAVTIFFRLLKDEIREEYWCQTNDYSDVPSDMWCNNAISTLTNMGIIDGFNDGTFRPNAKVTRAQFAKMAVGFFETTKEDYQGFFSDVPADAWYTEYVEAAARVGLIGGFSDGTYRPNTPITRAQACVIMNRVLGRKPDKEHLLSEDVMVTWVDCTPDDWFYADMQEATNSHDYEWVTVNSAIMENWTAKLPQRDWAALEHEWSNANSAPGGEVLD